MSKQRLEELLSHFSDAVMARAQGYLKSDQVPYAQVFDAMRYSISAGGKRIRPALVFLFCRLCGGIDSNAVDFAVAVEMIHTYSLIHDDLPCMDDDDLRRGKPSCHKQFSESTALLAGDGLLTMAFEVLSGAPVGAQQKILAISELAQAAGARGMIGGQVTDLVFEQTPSVSLSELSAMHTMKTGKLIEASCVLGCIAADATEKQFAAAREYALNLGLAFQIVDDVLDVTGDETILGKPVGSDADNGKTTYATLMGIGKAKEKAKELTEKAVWALSVFEGDTGILLSLTEYLLNRSC